MTPKEKADSLIAQYRPICQYKMGMDKEYVLSKVKECALIAVDEIIIEQCKSSELKDAKYQDNRILYWQEVKAEIEKI